MMLFSDNIFPIISIPYNPLLGSPSSLIKEVIPNSRWTYNVEGDKIYSVICKPHNLASFSKVRFDFSNGKNILIEFISPRPIPDGPNSLKKIMDLMPYEIQEIWEKAFNFVEAENPSDRESLAVLANYICSFDIFISNISNFKNVFNLKPYNFLIITNGYIKNAFGEDFSNDLKDVLRTCCIEQYSCGVLNYFGNGYESSTIVYDDYEPSIMQSGRVSESITNYLSNSGDVPSAIENLFTRLAIITDEDSTNANSLHSDCGLTFRSIYKYIDDYCPFRLTDITQYEIFRQIDYYIVRKQISARYLLDRKTNRWVLCYIPANIGCMPILRLMQLAMTVFRAISNNQEAVYKDIFGELLGIVKHECKSLDLDVIFDVSLGYMWNWHLAYRLPNGIRYYDVVERLIDCGLFRDQGESIIPFSGIEDHPSLHKINHLNGDESFNITYAAYLAYNKWDNSGFRYSYAYPVLNTYFLDDFDLNKVRALYICFLKEALKGIENMEKKIAEDPNSTISSEEYEPIFYASKKLHPYYLSESVSKDDAYFEELNEKHETGFYCKLYTTRSLVILNLLISLYMVADAKLAKVIISITSNFLRNYDKDLEEIAKYISKENFTNTKDLKLLRLIKDYIKRIVQ